MKRKASNVVAPGAPAAPGDVVGSSETHRAGEGTYADGDAIRCSLLGTVVVEDGVVSTVAKNRRPAIEVGTIVIGEVTRVR